jgi:hypothetical protein
MEQRSEFDGRQKTGVGSYIVYATQEGYLEISGFEDLHHGCLDFGITRSRTFPYQH